jgi:hypothetical protein
MDILDPIGVSTSGSRGLAPRPASLEGVVVGVLDNAKPNARGLMTRIGALLVEQQGAREVRVFAKSGPSVPAEPGLLDEIARQCGLVLTGSGD